MSMRTLECATSKDEHGGVWEPWTDGHAVGFKVTRDGKTRYVYLNPSLSSDVEDSTTFCYVGENGDVEKDEPDCFFTIFYGDDEDLP